MNVMTAKTEQGMFALQSESLCGFLQTASARLRSGEDAEGIEGLLFAMSELEILVENDQKSQQPQIDMRRLLPAMTTLCFYIKNQDMAGIADLIEDVFYPMAGEWMKESESI
jgi:hypothetical protein